jgi:ATP-dependent exoDNAse (exonuclease V) beta subunit
MDTTQTLTNKIYIDLSIINKHERDKYISLDEKLHIYTIHNKQDYISVTTFVHSLFEKFNADKVIDNIINGRNYSNSKYFNMSKKDIKTLWKNNGSTAAKQGTQLHLDIENYYNNKFTDNDSIEYTYFKNFINDNKDLQPYRTEWKVWDEDYKITGTIDMLYINKNNDELMIYDWKRSKNIVKTSFYQSFSSVDCISHIPNLNFWHYSLQLNIYKKILERKYNKTITKLCLVCLYPDNPNYIVIDVPDLTDEVNNLFNLRKQNLNK